MKFPEQMPGEEVLMVIRKHSIVYARISFGFFMIFALPAFFILLFWYSQTPLLASNYNTNIVTAFVLLYLLYGLLFFIVAWLNEAFDLFILTTDRLLDVTQETLLRRNVATTPLEHIQDATGDVNGFIPTLLNYGNIEVQTAAGEASRFKIDHVADPVKLGNTLVHYARDKRNGESPKNVLES